jgi:hypothetical protein
MMRKTVKKISGDTGISETDDMADPGMMNNSEMSTFQTGGENVGYLDEIPVGITKLQTETRERDQKINQLLETMTSVDADDDGAKLANFRPPPNPEISMKKSGGITGGGYAPGVGVGSPADTPIEYQPNEYQPALPAQTVLQRPRPMGTQGVASADFDRQTAEYSNYNHVYNTHQGGHTRYSGGALPMSESNDALMKKVNYMIHMLEQQGVEKTANVTEEFILYTFLGVFIIYIVDSFSRSGRYIR